MAQTERGDRNGRERTRRVDDRLLALLLGGALLLGILASIVGTLSWLSRLRTTYAPTLDAWDDLSSDPSEALRGEDEVPSART